MVEVRVKEIISTQEIQKFLIKLTKEVTKFNDFMIIFKEEVDIFKECHLKLNRKREYVFNAREQQINVQHKAWRKHIKNKGG